MNLPASPSQPETKLHMLPLAMLDASRTNPRKRFDEHKLEELAASIKIYGVLQPLLVREITWQTKPEKVTGWPFPISKAEKENQDTIFEPSGRYEIIAGERRYRAAKIAGLDEAPCFVRNLTDTQVLHAQVIENLQRDDLHPIEEAEGYERLLKQQDAFAKKDQFNVDKIAAEIGKSRAYIYARLKLCDLCMEARQAFFNGHLDASTALLIARIPVPKLQVKAIQAITKKQEYNSGMIAAGDTMSYRAARDLIQRDFMTDLDRAPFPITDFELLANVGSCIECPDRTGNQSELFEDVSSPNVCTNNVCFGMKKAAHILSIRNKAEAEGHAVITGKDAKKILPSPQYNTYLNADSGYAKLSDRVPDDDQYRTWEEVLISAKALKPAKGKDKPVVQQTLIENTFNGNLIPAINIEQAVKALREAGFEISTKGNRQENTDNSKEKDERRAAQHQVNTYRSRLFHALRDKIKTDMSNDKPTVADGLYRIMAEHFYDVLDDYQDAEAIAKLYMPPVSEQYEDKVDLVDTFEKTIPAMTVQQHFSLLIDMMMIGEKEIGYYGGVDKLPETMLNIAAEIGIDADKIEKQAISEVKAAKKAEKTSSTPIPATPAKAKEKAIATKPAAQAQGVGA